MLSNTVRSVLCLTLLAPAGMLAQAGANACRASVANELGLAPGNVSTSGNSGVVEWEAIVGGRRVRGFCETDRSGRVTSTQLGAYRGGGFGGNNNNNNPGGGSIFGGGGGRNSGGGAVVAMRADTAGRGNLTAMGQNVRLSRGWVDTREEPTIALTGDNNFKITLYGVVTGSSQEREFTMRITRSDRGNASGNATVRMNNDRNEVEFIQVDGRVGGSPFSGTFTRN